ncbi:Uncharacterised conserved protein UCP015417-vWA [Striga hermonthica]|uniref:Uncharacterized conserved protein UCP015417-vWA n=1 Tax=Striga hermonthica TaxID=68872 RepID=A0A9N7P3X6_STRHE|nr:Uncharacterised conserved protein UCP015417-vWA [Striga hermonthica]
MASSATTTISLVGPPEINRNSTPPAAATAPATTGNPFMDLMVGNFNKTAVTAPVPPMGFTENFSPTLLSSGNPCLDFFFHVVPDTPPEALAERLKLAWEDDPLKALKLVCNLRGVRGTGKTDREGGYTAALWIHKNHPKTLACNVASLAKFGYFKDLLEILFRLVEGPDARTQAKAAYRSWKSSGSRRARELAKRRQTKKPKQMAPRYGGIRKQTQGRMRRRSNRPSNSNESPNQPKLSNEEKRLERAKKAYERFRRDPDYRFLHERVSDYFALCLQSDMENLKSGQSNKVSLAAKWCPSLDSSYDQVTLLCEPIAKKVFPRSEYPEYELVEEAHYAYRVRDHLRKQVLVPLRKALELPEVFLEHDEQRFGEYLEKVDKGEAKIAAGALLPHEIVAGLGDGDKGQVAELQWRRMVDDLAKKGKMSNCLAICDVSGSMYGVPMEVSVALGVLVSELSEEPWKGKLITFSADPKIQDVVGSSLAEKTAFVRRMEEVAVAGNLKPEKMIKRLLVFSDMEFDQARNKSPQSYYSPHPPPSYGAPSYYSGYRPPSYGAPSYYSPYPPPSYGAPSCYSGYRPPSYGLPSYYSGYPPPPYILPGVAGPPSTWETDYEVIVRKFGEKGYGECVPEIVFWNLRSSPATPVAAGQPGVALVSGYSKNMMKVFLEEGRIISPQAVMNQAIAGKEYEELWLCWIDCDGFG